MGDVNENAIPDIAAPVASRWNGDWPITTPNPSFLPGETVELVFLAEWEKMAAVQFTLHFDETALDLVRVDPLDDQHNRLHLGLRPQGKNCITVSFENLRAPLNAVFAGAPLETQLFRVKFRAKIKGKASDFLRLAPAPAFPVAYRADGSAYKPAVFWKELGDVLPELTVFPNPFGSSGVWFQWPEQERNQGTLRIYDGQGRQILHQQISAKEQIPATVFDKKGIYWYDLQINGKPFSGKLVYQGG